MRKRAGGCSRPAGRPRARARRRKEDRQPVADQRARSPPPSLRPPRRTRLLTPAGTRGSAAGPSSSAAARGRPRSRRRPWEGAGGRLPAGGEGAGGMAASARAGGRRSPGAPAARAELMADATWLRTMRQFELAPLLLLLLKQILARAAAVPTVVWPRGEQGERRLRDPTRPWERLAAGGPSSARPPAKPSAACCRGCRSEARTSSRSLAGAGCARSTRRALACAGSPAGRTPRST